MTVTERNILWVSWLPRPHGKAAAYFDPWKFKIESLQAEAEQARQEGREFQ